MQIFASCDNIAISSRRVLAHGLRLDITALILTAVFLLHCLSQLLNNLSMI